MVIHLGVEKVFLAWQCPQGPKTWKYPTSLV